MTTGYLLDNQNEHAGSRFEELENLFDPLSHAILRTIPLPPGARCWEVGCGSGSIARHLYTRVKPARGHVLATDIDLSLANLPRGIMALRHDVDNDAPAAGPWNLIHARLVIQHLADPERAIAKLVDVLAPGGWLVVEELDPIIPYCPDPRNEADQLLNRVGNAFTELLHRHATPKLGRHLHRDLTRAGLSHVRNHGHVFPCIGGSAGARLMQVNIQQTARQLVNLGRGLSFRDLDAYVDLLNDPDIEITLPVFYAARGQKL